MLNLSYNISPILKDYLEKIDTLRTKILCVPISPYDEAYLRFQATVDRVYYSLLLSGEEVTREEVLSQLSHLPGETDDPHLEGGSRGRLILGYKKALDYISQDWRVSSEKVTSNTIINLYRLITSKNKTISNHLLNDLTAYVQIKPEHPVIESAIALIGLLKIHVFPDANARLSRLLALLFLSKYGYDCRGFLVLEKCWGEDLSGYRETLRQFMKNDNITLWLEYFAHSMCIALEDVLVHLRGVPKNQHHLGGGANFWSLNQRQKKIMTYLESMPKATITNKIVQSICTISQITAARDLAKLTIMGVLLVHRKGRSTYYTKA